MLCSTRATASVCAKCAFHSGCAAILLDYLILLRLWEWMNFNCPAVLHVTTRDEQLYVTGDSCLIHVFVLDERQSFKWWVSAQIETATKRQYRISGQYYRHWSCRAKTPISITYDGLQMKLSRSVKESQPWSLRTPQKSAQQRKPRRTVTGERTR